MKKNNSFLPVLVLFLFFLSYSVHRINAQSISDSVITLNTHLDNNYWIKNKKEVYLYLDLQALKLETNKKRPPMNISIVLDRSGSMSGAKMKFAIDACKFIVDNLNEEDVISVVSYDDKVELVYGSSVIKNKVELNNLISTISSRGSTNLSGGLEEGYKQVKSTYDRNRVNRVLLITDGLANAGITDSTMLAQIVKNKNLEEGITVSTFGVGAGFNERLLTSLADNGNGNYYFIDKAENIKNIFARELNGLVSVIANNTKLTVNYPSFYLSPVASFGYKFESKGQEISYDLKDVISMEQKSMLIKFNLKNDISEPVVFNTRLEYNNAVSKNLFTTLTNDTLVPTTDNGKFELSYNDEATANVAMFETNEITEKAMDDMDSRSYDKAKEKLSNAKKILKDQQKRSPKNKAIEKQLLVVDDYEKNVERAKNMKDEELNMMQKASRNMNYETKKKK